MNTLIDPLKQIARDLVEKKLWPVAALLLAAVVAVPVLLGGSSAEPVPAPPAAVVAGGPDASKSLVTVVDQPVTGEDDRPGPIDDPFYDPPEPAEPANVDGGAAAPAADAAKGGAAADAGDGASAGETPAQTPEAPAEEIDPSVYYSTVVRWWEKDPSKAGPIRRLTPFGGLADPAALYLGVTKSNGNYAVFLLGPNATSDGEAKCEDAECRVFGLKSGQTQIVTVTPPDGGEARQYNLDVVSVKAHAADADTLRKMRIRVHADGRDVMREMWSDARTAEALRPVQYDQTAGLLVKSATAATAAAAAASE
jgi:hypothetical protein